MKSVIEIKKRLREWVADNSKSATRTEVYDDTQIIENRIITSIQVMDLILFMEHLLGKPVKPDQIRPGSFATINAIYDSFFQTGEE